MKSSTIYVITFTSGHTVAFGSVAAIFDTYTERQLGVSAKVLYASGITTGTDYLGDRCTIRKVPLIRKAQSKR